MSDKSAGSGGPIVGVVSSVLAFMDRPWKAVVLIVMLVLGGLGYVLYEERAQIAAAILAHEVNPRLDLATFTRDAPQVLRDTHAFGILLMEVRLGDNVAVVLDGLDRDGHPWIPLPGPHQAISETIDQVILVKFLRNEVVCFPFTSEMPNPEASAAARRYEIKRGCVIEVPPIMGIMVGALVVAWQDPPDRGAEDQARIIMTEAAMRFAVW